MPHAWSKERKVSWCCKPWCTAGNPHLDCLSNGSNGLIKQGLGEATPQASQASSSCTSLSPRPPFSMAVKHKPCSLTLRKGRRPSKPGAGGSFSVPPTWSTKPTTGCGARSTSLWTHRKLFRQLSRDGHSLCSGMSHATTASPKPSFRAPWKVQRHGLQRKC